MGRRLWVVVHRWAGLLMAVQLTAAGLFGAILAFDPQVTDLVNPGFVRVTPRPQPPLDPFTLRERALAADPRATFDQVILHGAPNEVPCFFGEPRLDPATGKPFDLGYIGLCLDPYDGHEIARLDGALWPVTRQNFLPVVYALHMSLCCGTVGAWAFGIAALIWLVDAFVALYLTFPAGRRDTPAAAAPPRRSWLSRWRPSWLVTWGAGPWRFNFDLHRAAGLWLWPFFLIFAVSSVAFNLPQVYEPVMRGLFHMPDPEAAIPDLPAPRPAPRLGFREAVAIGERLVAAEGRRLGFEPRQVEGSAYMSYDPAKGIYTYPAHTTGDVGYHAPGARVFIDGDTGDLKGIALASGGHWTTSFNSWISAIHGATVGGLAMRVVVAVVGLATALLSTTGVWIWWRKRSFRAATRRTRPAPT